MVANVHTLALVGIRKDATSETFYRWTFSGPLTAIGVVALDEAVGFAKVMEGFESWHLACSCEWRSVEAKRPTDLAGVGFIHLLSRRVGP